MKEKGKGVGKGRMWGGAEGAGRRVRPGRVRWWAGLMGSAGEILGRGQAGKVPEKVEGTPPGQARGRLRGLPALCRPLLGLCHLAEAESGVRRSRGGAARQADGGTAARRKPETGGWETGREREGRPRTGDWGE